MYKMNYTLRPTGIYFRYARFEYKKYCEQLYTNRVNDLGETDEFLDKLLQLIQKVENLNTSLTNNCH